MQRNEPRNNLHEILRIAWIVFNEVLDKHFQKRYPNLYERKYYITMNVTRKQVIEKIEFAIEEGRMEDAVLCVVYQLSYGSHQRVGEHAILKRLNQYLKKPFTMDDLQISLALLKQRGLIAE